MKHKIKLIATRGLPASGKTYWAEKMVLENDGQYVNVCKDDLRSMMHAKKHSSGREKLILEVQNAIIDQAILNQKNVIVSNTHLNPVTLQKLVDRYSSNSILDLSIQDFTNVDLFTCIQRDSKRQNPVGKNVIMDMYNKWLKPPQMQQDIHLPKACIFDLDGTLFDKHPSRGYYDWNLVHLDIPKPFVVNLLNLYKKMNYRIILMSGRKNIARAGTIESLENNDIPYDELHMRADSDDRSDDIVKEELFNYYVLGKFYVEAIIDDRPKVVRMWHAKGLNVLSVNHPDNEF